MNIIDTLEISRYYTYNSTKSITTKGSIYRLHKALKQNRVDEKDIQELIEIVKSEEPDFENRQLGEKAIDWILKVFGKVINSEGKINPNLTALSLATFIKEYYAIAD